MSATSIITMIEREKVARLNDLHRRCEQSYSDALAYALEAGNILISIKADLRHGEFGTWLGEHFEGSDRTARQYMQLASSKGRLPNRHDRADLTLTEAREQIATPRVSAGEMRDVFGRAGVAERPAPEPSAAAPSVPPQKDRRASELIGEIRDGYEQAHDEALISSSRARLYRDAAVRAQRLAVLLDELASSLERR